MESFLGRRAVGLLSKKTCYPCFLKAMTMSIDGDVWTRRSRGFRCSSGDCVSVRSASQELSGPRPMKASF